MKNGLIIVGCFCIAGYCLGGMHLLGYAALGAGIALLIRGK